MDPLTILQERFGFDSFRFNQEAIIQSVLSKKDTFVLMPTGGGKSLCYQIPALIMEGVAVVVSPLIALMKDQVDQLRRNGIDAAYLNSGQTTHEQELVLKRIEQKKLKLLYVAPEKLIAGDKPSPLFTTLSQFSISLLAIDEAHCISHWGHDFRPEYLMLATLKGAWTNVPTIALTATADRHTQRDIIEKLDLDNPGRFVSSFNRPNIKYTVRPKHDNFEQLMDFLTSRRDQSGIIYCLSRKSTEALADRLGRYGFDAVPYHAGLEREVRSSHQEMFQRNVTKIVVATIAFGMGIDKPNVRYVVHMDLPKNIESYYQETGRAGRDGLPADALLFYSPADVAKLKKFAMIENNPKQTKILLKKLDEMGRFGELNTCRRKYLLNYFNETSPNYCGNCDACLGNADLFDGTEEAERAIRTVRALRQKFGVNYLIDVLRGSQSSRIDEDHRALGDFGSGRHLSRAEWTDVFHDLVAAGYLRRSEGIYPVLRITEKGADITTSGEKIWLSRRQTHDKPVRELSTPACEGELLQCLRDLRRQLARRENVTDQLVFSDTTLTAIAACVPQTPAHLSLIPGVVPEKLAKYGTDILKAVGEYARQYRLNFRSPSSPDPLGDVEEPRHGYVKGEWASSAHSTFSYPVAFEIPTIGKKSDASRRHHHPEPCASVVNSAEGKIPAQPFS